MIFFMTESINWPTAAIVIAFLIFAAFCAWITVKYSR